MKIEYLNCVITTDFYLLFLYQKKFVITVISSKCITTEKAKWKFMKHICIYVT